MIYILGDGQHIFSIWRWWSPTFLVSLFCYIYMLCDRLQPPLSVIIGLESSLLTLSCWPVELHHFGPRPTGSPFRLPPPHIYIGPVAGRQRELDSSQDVCRGNSHHIAMRVIVHKQYSCKICITNYSSSSGDIDGEQQSLITQTLEYYRGDIFQCLYTFCTAAFCKLRSEYVEHSWWAARCVKRGYHRIFN